LESIRYLILGSDHLDRLLGSYSGNALLGILGIFGIKGMSVMTIPSIIETTRSRILIF